MALLTDGMAEIVNNQGRYYWADRPASTYIYAITADEHLGDGAKAVPLKIGMTTQPGMRLGQLQAGCWGELKYAAAFYCPRDFLKAVEAACHKRFRQYHLRREWFKLSLDMARHGMALEIKAAGFKPYTMAEIEEKTAEIDDWLRSINSIAA